MTGKAVHETYYKWSQVLTALSSKCMNTNIYNMSLDQPFVFGTTAINIKAMLEMFKNGPCLIKCDKPTPPNVPQLLIFT